jgi:hypothetical protein
MSAALGKLGTLLFRDLLLAFFFLGRTASCAAFSSSS